MRRDADMFDDVMLRALPLLVNGLVHPPLQKLDFAYDAVAATWGVDRSTVVRAVGRAVRSRRITAANDEERRALRTPATYVRWRLRRIERLLAAADD